MDASHVSHPSSWSHSPIRTATGFIASRRCHFNLLLLSGPFNNWIFRCHQHRFICARASSVWDASQRQRLVETRKKGPRCPQSFVMLHVKMATGESLRLLESDLLASLQQPLYPLSALRHWSAQRALATSWDREQTSHTYLLLFLGQNAAMKNTLNFIGDSKYFNFNRMT